jgi:hypothetical protein
MIAYQIIEIDYDYPMVLSTYLDKNKAQTKLDEILKQQQKLNTQYEKCLECPVYKTTKRKFNKNNNLIFDYCKNISYDNLVFDGNNIFCNHKLNNIGYDDSRYVLEEIEIIE